MADKERFKRVNENDLETLINNTQAKRTKYMTNYAVKIFKGTTLYNFCVYV